ncbi:MAG: Hsp20/alpha crystallin family protein [Gallionellaceae bacterium]
MANITQRSPSFSKLTRFDPFRDDDWLKGFWMRPFPRELEAAPQIKIDLTENDKSYTVRAEIPGVKKEDIKVNVDGKRVSISAESKQEKEEKKGGTVICRECYQGSSYRSFTLDSDVDEAKAQAKYDNGVLELTLPKKNGSTAKQLQIN